MVDWFTEGLQSRVSQELLIDGFDLIIAQLQSFEQRNVSEGLLVELLSEQVAVEIELLQFRCVERGDQRELVAIELENFQRGKHVVDRRRPLRELIRGEIELFQVAQSREDRQVDVTEAIVLEREHFQVQRQIQLIDRLETIVVEVELAQMVQMDEKGQVLLGDELVVAQVETFQLRGDQLEDVLVDGFDTYGERKKGKLISVVRFLPVRRELRVDSRSSQRPFASFAFSALDR